MTRTTSTFGRRSIQFPNHTLTLEHQGAGRQPSWVVYNHRLGEIARYRSTDDLWDDTLDAQKFVAAELREARERVARLEHRARDLEDILKGTEQYL